jgi:hypothetical protein
VFERYLAAPDEPVVVATLHGLGGLADESAAELVRKHSTDKRPLVRSAAFAGMLRVAEARNPQDAAALEVYTQAVKTEGLGDPEKRRALLGLARIADPASLPVLQPVLDKPGPLGAEAAAAANAIAPKLKDKPRAIALLRRVLEITTARDEVVAAAKALRDLGETVDIAASGGFITGWWVAGPMAPRKDLREKDALDPAKSVDVSQPVAWGDAQFQWKFAHVDDPLGLLDLEVACARRDDVGCYVYAEVQSDTERDVTLRIGSDDDVVLWVNGKQVHSFIGDRGWTLDQDTAHAHLAKGTNKFLCKVLQGGGQWSVSVRLADADSKPVVLPQKRP